MFDVITKVFNELTATNFQLGDLPDFPWNYYQAQQAMYEESERWFTGLALEDKASNDQKVDLYPLKINPLLNSVFKHAHILFGETENNGKPLVYPKFIAKTPEEKILAKEAEAALDWVWYENNGDALMQENAILSQIYGGCVFKATYVPWEGIDKGGWRKVPIRIERINPKGFIGIPDSGDMYRLKECWVVRQIPNVEALQWGYTGTDKIVYMVEHWTRDSIVVFVNNQVAYIQSLETGKIELGGDNPFKKITTVYIPHIRAGNFLGMNMLDPLKGIVKEYNLRFADYGDAINEDSHGYVAMRNVNGVPSVRTIAEGLNAIDLGSSNNISGNEPDPDLFEVRKQRAGQSMSDMVDKLVETYRRESSVPAVADGEDEGSQRSSLTLATRFWPLTTHATMERRFWTPGLDVFQNILLTIMAEKGLENITPKHLLLRSKQHWANMLPKDREVDVQEWVARSSANLGSIDTLLDLTGDIEDIEEEKTKILDWIAKKAETTAVVTAKYAPKPAPINPMMKKKPAGGMK